MNIVAFICLLIVFAALAFAEVTAYSYANNRKYILSSDRNPRKTKYKPLALLLIFVFCWFCATRSINTHDTVPYVNSYLRLDVNLSNFFNYYGEFEVGFEFLTKFLKLFFGENYLLYFAFFPLFNCFMVYRAFKHFRLNRNVLLLIYIAIIGLTYNSIVLRQGVSMSFIVIAFSYLKRKKGIAALIFVLVATLFHKSAILVLAVIPFYMSNKKRSNDYYYCILIIAYVFYLSGLGNILVERMLEYIISLNLLPVSYSKYIIYLTMSQNTNHLIINKTTIRAAAMFIFVVWLAADKNKTTFEEKTLKMLVFSMVIYYIFHDIEVMQRYLDYFNIAIAILLAANLYKKRRGKLIMSVGMVTMFMLIYINTNFSFL